MSDDDTMIIPIDELKRKTKVSPLNTSKRDEQIKRKFIKEHGKDKDGAFRVSGRIDRK